MTRLRLVGFSANLQRPSKTRALVEAIAEETAARLPVEVRLFDVVDAGPGLGAAWARADLPLPARRIVEAIEEADGLIVGSPVYKGAYTGLFKHLFDFVEPGALVNRPVALAATGGGPRHALVVERPCGPAPRCWPRTARRSAPSPRAASARASAPRWRWDTSRPRTRRPARVSSRRSAASTCPSS
jgi:MsuE subfamily FMN reductase